MTASSTPHTQPLTPQQELIIDLLTDAAHGGLTQQELLMLGDFRTAQRLSTVLSALLDRGLVYGEYETGGESRKWKRWRLVGFRPKAKPVLQTSIAAPRTGTLADPFGIGIPPRVVDPAQCRPWAMAAASRGGVVA